MSVEGHYRLLSHNEEGKAVYGKLAGDGTLTWARNWREATTFLTHESALVARDAARQAEPQRDIGVAQRFRDWQAWKKTTKKPGNAKAEPKEAAS